MSDRVVKRIEESFQTWSREGFPPFTEEDVIYPESDGLPNELRNAERAAREGAQRIAEAERAAKEAVWARLRELGIDPGKL